MADGFEEIEAITPIDILRRANLDVTTVSITNDLMVTGAHAITLKADISIKDVNTSEIDMAVLPGGMPGSKNLNESTEVKNILQDLSVRGKLIGAICAAPMVLGNMGLLKDKKAICYPGFEDQMKGAILASNKVETDTNITTGKGPGVSTQFALRLVELLVDQQTADEIAAAMML